MQSKLESPDTSASKKMEINSFIPSLELCEEADDISNRISSEISDSAVDFKTVWKVLYIFRA